ncbi:MAG TPA: GNAT family N-acetyltransferase [Bdellovibrionota bacterium]|jgi:GNAT superfamily N-acetyltransferase|nr:GNAT family N-acetyltransferase [Bdellovibrionota bacterium]
MVKVRTLPRSEWAGHLDEIAALRIEIFRSFPYLYEGTLDYETSYLQGYLESSAACLVGAFDDTRLVGISTAIHMPEAEAEFQTPFREVHLPLEQIVYFGESLLKAQYRGQGIGGRFFDEREAFATSLGKIHLTTFASVVRDVSDPRTPADYAPLDEFWNKRGYTKRRELRTAFEWLEIGATSPTRQSMVFWCKAWP